MSGYRYFVPIVSIAPPAGYRLREVVRLDAIAALLDVPETELVIERRVFADGAEVARYPVRLGYRNGSWSGDDPVFELDSVDDGAWRRGESVGYVETHISLDGPGHFGSAADATAGAVGSAKRMVGFAAAFAPPSYKIFYGPERKTFFSDSTLKYGNTVVIYQIDSFGKQPGFKWVEGYPLAAVDRDADIDESVVLINPFTRPTTVRIDLSGIEKSRKVRVDPQRARRIDLAGLIGERPHWRGQILVSGPARLITMFAKHSLADPCQITTLEHSDPYRGEPTHMPLTRRLRQVVGGAVQGWTRPAR